MEARTIAAVPLNGRSYTDLLSLQTGVAPATSITTASIDDLGAQILNPSGMLNPGTVSVNGQREFANFFSVNGADVEEDVNAGSAIIPNLDSIEEFTVVTGNFDAEHGQYSGGQIIVTTKSGTDKSHGSVFEFLRNTALDARNYFSQTRGIFRQNQFGGTLGGPLRPGHAFCFADYQGTRQTQGIDTGNIGVPTDAERSGDFSAPTIANTLTGAVSGPYLAGLLSNALGQTVTNGESYFTQNCASSSECVFPGAVIPKAAWSVPAQRLLQYIPAPNNASGTFSTSAFNQIISDDKGAIRVDKKIGGASFFAYYFNDGYTLNNPYPVAQSGSSVPGFNALNSGRAQLLSLSATENRKGRTVQEQHVSYMRDSNDLGRPMGGCGVPLESQGFVNSDGSSSIVALDPRGECVENIDFNGFSIGSAANELLQTNNTYHLSDQLSRVSGRHALKIGGEFDADQVNDHAIAQFNGNFVFSGTETGNDFADFLIGIASQYNQSQLNPFYARNKYAGLFAQNSWHPRDDLTLNYGLRWDRNAPWTEKHNEISTFTPGQQSAVFPGAPAGILYPGDPGVAATLAPAGELSFAPRVGVAWSPTRAGGLANRILGAPGTTSVRASYGMFYTAVDALSIGVLAANAPFGVTYTSPEPPLFATPFINVRDRKSNGQPFPVVLATGSYSSTHPDTQVDWSSFEPISGIPAFDRANRTPYTEEWMLSLEHELGTNAVIDIGYVGNESHRQRVLRGANPGDPALCLSLHQTQDVLSGTPTCGPGGEDTVYYPASGGVVDGTRGPLGSAFGGNALQSTIGVASYHGLQTSVHYITSAFQLSASYAYSKSLDLASNVGEDVNPIDPRLSYALSSFDVRQNFAMTFDWKPRFDRIFEHSGWSREWNLSGILHANSGFPVTMVDNSDDSLLGSNPNGVNNSSVDEPDLTGIPPDLSLNPRNASHLYFNPLAFATNGLGTAGDAKRRFFPGPGQTNFDLAASKGIPLGDLRTLDLRLEAFNTFNHAQFFGASTVDGNIGSSTFGQVIGAGSPRLMQAALKLSF